MKKTYLLTLLFTILLIMVIKLSEAQTPVAYYQFSGNANDAVGPNHGTVMGGATLTTNRFSQANSAYTFDGIDDKITVPDAPAWDFGTGDFSLTAWINVNNISTQRIVSAGHNATGDIWGLGFGNNGVWGSGTRINFFLHNGAYVDYSSAALNYTIGTWAFIAVVRSGTQLSMYYNNILVGSFTTSLVANAGSSLTIGARQHNPGNYIEYFDGKIDEVNIYNKAVSQQHLADLYASNLVAYYPYSSNPVDFSGHSNNGTASGAVLTTDRFNSAGSAYTFNGIGDNIQAPNNSTFALLNNYSVSAWVKAVSTPPAAGGGTGFAIAGKDEGSGNNVSKWIFALQNGGLAFHLNGPGLINGLWLYSNPFTLDLNQWYHCAMSKSGNNITFYVNGTNLGTYTLSSPSVDPAAPFSVGYSEPGINFNGAIDQVKLYNTSLTTEEIKNDFSNSALVANYPFNGNANDESGNGNNGILPGVGFNPTLTSDRFGNANSAYSFDGGDWIEATNSTSLQLTNSYTISAWVKPNVFQVGPPNQSNFILAKNVQFQEGHYNLQYSDFLDGNPGALTPSQMNFVSSLYKGGTEWSAYPNPVTQPTELNKWYQVVSTFDGTNLKLYVNGVLRNSTTVSGTFGTLSTGNLNIGRSVAGEYYVNGIIDDVKIYAAPLAASKIFDDYVNDLRKPGSGNALVLNFATAQYIDVGNNWDQAGSFSFETWVKRTSLAATDPTAQIFMQGTANNGWGIGIEQTAGPNQNKLVLTKTGVSGVFSNSTLSDLNWHHVAVVFDAGANTTAFYIDGMLDASVPYSPGGFNSGNGTYSIGVRGTTGLHLLNAVLDETRIWSGVVLTAADIRNWMCRKINSSHPSYQSLQGYFRYDEGTGTMTGGYNARFGTLVNTPTWQTSGASLGDESAHSYGGSSVSLGAAGTGATINSFTGSPSGMQLYRVNEAPNTTAVPAGIHVFKSNNYYYGVFPVAGTAPTYRYAQNVPGLYPNNSYAGDSMTQVLSRPSNSGTWSYGYGVNNATNDSMVVTGASTEYAIAINKNNNKKPGSGNTLVFDNNNSQYLELGNGWDQAGSFSFETWIKRTSTAVTDGASQTFIASVNDNGWGVGINQFAGNQNKLYLSKIGVSQVISTSTITDVNWHHVAVTFNSSTNQALFYIDGNLDATVAYNPGGFNTGNTNYRLGGRNSGPNLHYFNGRLDETRIWSGVVLTQTQIRDWMCKKLTPVHPAFANLSGYFRFDEGNGTTTGGYNARFATLINAPAWQTSGASLGDASVHDYVNATKTANISHASGENFSATETSGTPAGIHVYRVDENPNSNTGANNGGNNKYFGVFQSGGTSPQYTAVYNYNGNPLVNAGNEPELRLAKRADNSVSMWTLMSTLPNEPANTITVTGESTEYILGKVGSPLPITLFSFAGSKCNNNICLLWSTENEQNLSHFELEKSNNGNNFTLLTTATASNQPGRNTYNSIDITPFNGVNYYRLKIVNADGSFVYSKIIRIDLSKPSLITIQPNPASDRIFIKGLSNGQIKITDMSGRTRLQTTIRFSIEEINISAFESGIYIVQIINENNITSLKLVKQ